MAEAAERIKMMRARRRRLGVARIAPHCAGCAFGTRAQPDSDAGGKLNPDSEREALLWIEAVSEFDASAPR
jgi:hypothetical protein